MIQTEMMAELVRAHQSSIMLLTAGLGSRLESLTGSVNKALLPVEDKAIISHIIDLTPSNIDIVVSLGYCGNLVRDYLTAVYPNRNFTFVEVDNITGPESGQVLAVDLQNISTDRFTGLPQIAWLMNFRQLMVIG